jgi:hypothetical protein
MMHAICTSEISAKLPTTIRCNNPGTQSMSIINNTKSLMQENQKRNQSEERKDEKNRRRDIMKGMNQERQNR